MFQSLIFDQPITPTKPQYNFNESWVSLISSVQEECRYQLAHHNVIERLQSLSKPHIALGTFVSLIIFFKFGGQILTNTISWAYPAYASFKAIESPSTEDDTQWLIYWTVIGFVRIVIYFLDVLFYWSYVYYTFKTVVILWLVLPQFKGAEIVYSYFLRPYLLNVQPEIECSIKNISDKFNFTLFAREK